MRKKIKQELIRMLRLDGYAQTRDFLKRKNRFCVLGLLCELYQEHTGRGSWEGPYDAGKNNVRDASCFLAEDEWSIELPSPAILRWAGMDKELAMKLYKLNDVERQTFAGIANYLEAMA